MAYEQKPGTGSIFRNENKQKDSHPDYRGTITTPSGESLELSLWVKEAQSGKKYFSVAAQPPYRKDESPDGERQRAEEQRSAGDDLPF